MQSYTGVSYPATDGPNGRIWVVYVEKFDDECEVIGDCVGFHVTDMPGLIFVETSSSAPVLATAHEWGHAIGCDHLEIEGSVMHTNITHVGDFVPKQNWDEVDR